LGAAMCAALGAGVYPDLTTAAARMADCEEVVEPDPTVRGRYKSLYKRWLKTYRKLLGR
jgi:autoinducer 2 (AI-2) kinase